MDLFHTVFLVFLLDLKIYLNFHMFYVQSIASECVELLVFYLLILALYEKEN